MPTSETWQRLLTVCLFAHMSVSILTAGQESNTSAYNPLPWIDSRPEPEGYGIVPVPGFPLDQPFPGHTDTPSSDWQLEVRFQLSTCNCSRQTRTTLTHKLLPPPANAPRGNFSVPENTSSTWTLWVASIADFNTMRLPEIDEGNNKDNGSCPDSALNYACQNELREAIRTDSSVLAGSGKLMSSQLSEKTPSCDANWVGFKMEGTIASSVLDLSGYGESKVYLLIEDHAFTVIEVPLDDPRKFNGSTTWHSGDWYMDKESALLPFHRFGIKTWPLIFVWGHSNSSGEAGRPLSADHVVIACVKVETVARGLEMPTWSAGSRAGFGRGAGGKAVALVLGVIWWCV